MHPGILEPNRVLNEYQLAEILGFKDNFEALKSFLENLDVKPVLFGKSAFYPTTPIVIAFERASQGRWVSDNQGGKVLVPAEAEDWIGRAEAAKFLDVTTKTIDRMAAEGRIKRKYFNKSPRFERSNLKRTLTDN